MSRFFIISRILAPILLMVFLSLLILNSVDHQSFVSQLAYLLIGAILFILILSVHYNLYTFSPWPWFLVAIALLVLTHFFGTNIRGSVRWLNLFGISVQTSEFVKPLLVLFAASFLVKRPLSSLKLVIAFLALSSIILFLVFIQPDLGTMIALAAIIGFALLSSGVSFRHVGVLILIGALMSPLLYQSLKPYQRERIVSFANPSADPLGSGYNSVQAAIAIGSGRVFGRGLGQGTQSQLQFLPERQTDFIFASLVEELGFIGGFLLIAAYTWLCWGLLTVARRSSTEIGSLVCLVTAGLIMFQVMVNIGMNVNLLPITGITLPLVSAGGSSLISFLALLGVCTSVALHANVKKAPLEIR